MDTKNQQIENLDTLREAIEALAIEAGVRFEIHGTDVWVPETNYRADALVRIGQNKKIYVEVKRHAQQANVGAIINQIQRLPSTAIFVADYINPVMAGKLKQENIQFIDTAGNAFINLEPMYIYITGKKQKKERIENTRDEANRAFEPKGLLVTYAILTNPGLLNRPYREIAAATDVALGTVAWVIKALKAGRYIHDDARNNYRRITNYQALLDRWVEAWPEKLKPKHRLGIFATDDPNGWKRIDIQKYEGYWGGETAAAIYTNYLKPEVTTVYIPRGNLPELIRDLRLRKPVDFDRGALVELNTPFWPSEDSEKFDLKPFDKIDWNIDNSDSVNTRAKPGVVNPVLAYADLIATGDTRNIEVARKLLNERITRLDRED